jgi:hypothetical protein
MKQKTHELYHEMFKDDSGIVDSTLGDGVISFEFENYGHWCDFSQKWFLGKLVNTSEEHLAIGCFKDQGTIVIAACKRS